MKLLRLTGICVCLASTLLSGCGSFGGLDQEYTEQRIEAVYAEEEKQTDRAGSFAADLCVVTGTESQSDPGVSAEAAAVFGLDDRSVPFEKQVFERMYPASITKVMTALVVLKYGDLQDMVTVGNEVIITEAGASLCHIKPGDTLSMEQLLYGLMLPSGNDAGAAIAVHMAGSIDAFSNLMNQEAQALGATDSHFLNPHGLHDEQHYTTAYDLYLIFQEALKYPEFRTVIGATAYTADYVDGSGAAKSQTWSNSNKYLTGEQETPEGVTVLGGKTGTTKAAGYCLITAEKDAEGKEFISVVLKADNRPDLYANMTNIIRKIVN